MREIQEAVTPPKPASVGVEPTGSAEMPTPRVGEYGYRGSGLFGYTCLLCGGVFGPFGTEDAARQWADLHASECSHA